MILTQCAVCATELGLSLGKKCGRCSTRYCGAECQVQHWKEGGHDNLCKLIKKAGGAEQYNANKKYAEAVAVAVEKCADDTKGQTCYICTQALHWKTKEGLVRGCACRGTAGVAHVSCLMEQAKILVAEGEENHSDDSQWHRWYRCSLCEQKYHGDVNCALGWACWKTYLGRPETDWTRSAAMTQLGNGLDDVRLYEDSLSVKEAELAMHRRLGASEEEMLVLLNNLACTYVQVGRCEESLSMYREVFSGRGQLDGEEDRETLLAASNYTNALAKLSGGPRLGGLALSRQLHRAREAKALSRKLIPVARRVLGQSDEITLRMRSTYARAIYEDSTTSLDDLREAVNTLKDTARIAQRVFGGTHPLTDEFEQYFTSAAVALFARERGDEVTFS